MRRLLLITPHTLSSGEAITALHVAESAIVHGSAIRVLASEYTFPFLESRLPGRCSVLRNDLILNQLSWTHVLRNFDPDIVLFADYPLLAPNAGGVPMADEAWVRDVENLDAVLLTFDHLGLIDNPDFASVCHQTVLPLPARMKTLLPCPIHEPRQIYGRRGIRFQYWRAPSEFNTDVRVETRAQYLDHADNYLVFHAVPRWAQALADLQELPYYRYLSKILGLYLADLPFPVTVVSVNDGSLLSDCPVKSVRVINLPSLPPQDYDRLLTSSDLLLTENCFSVSMGKAICASVPVVLWRNTLDCTTLLCSAEESLREIVTEMLMANNSCIYPWVSFPCWTPQAVGALKLFEQNSISEAIAHLEIFGGSTTAEVLLSILTKSSQQEQLRIGQENYIRRLSELPDPYEAIQNLV